MKIPVTAFIFSGLVLLAGACPGAGQESTWDSPPVAVQLQMDPTIVPIGKGAVFVPVMTDSDNEPVYGIISDGRMIQDSKTGYRIPLAPGEYTVLYGSGTKDQMIQKKVRVEEGATTVVTPDWAGLVIEVIDESRTEVREYYELFSLDTGESYGIGQGIEDGLDEKLHTWILPPGNYKIVKPGNNINAVVNFGTIRLLPGELVHVNLVIDSDTENFLGFGLVSGLAQGKGVNRKWNARSELSGNALLNYSPSDASGLESDTNVTATIQLLTDNRYESGRHVLPVWLNIEEGLSLQGTKDLRKYTDTGELRLTYIYRLDDYINPYLRFTVDSHFFGTYQRFDDPVSLTVLNADGDSVGARTDVTKVKIEDGFSPVSLKEGFGATSTLFRSVPANFTLRSGFGARQTYARGAYVYDATNKQLRPVVTSSLTGVEMLLLGDLRIGKYVLITTEFDVLIPMKRADDWVYDGENRIRFNLTSSVSLLITHEYWWDETLRNNQSSYQMLLRFSRFL